MVETGQKVSVTYEGRFEDGTVFDRSADHDGTLDFIVGGGNIIAGFEDAVRGMELGDSATITILPADAYGEYDEKLVTEVPAENLPDGNEFAANIGKTVYLNREGEFVEALIKDASDDKVVLDFNHPMAGHTLVFDITLVAVGEDDGKGLYADHPHTEQVAQPAEPPKPGEKA